MTLCIVNPSTRLRMSGAMLLVPRYVFTAWRLVEHRDSFTFIIVSLVACVQELLTVPE